MPYRVRFVADELMPEGRAWVIVRSKAAGVTTLYLRESSQHLSTAEKEMHLEAAWAGYVQMVQDDPEMREQECYSSSATALPKDSMAAL